MMRERQSLLTGVGTVLVLALLLGLAVFAAAPAMAAPLCDPGITRADCVGADIDIIQSTGYYLDFGDAPDPPYSTLLANNAARHVVVSGIFLGGGVDGEVDGQPDANALGDDNDGNDDEDGVVFTTPLVPGEQATVIVTASVNGYLTAYLDFSDNGYWGDSGEKIFDNVSLAAGANTLSFPVPSGATLTDQTFVRFRYSSYSRPNSCWEGQANDGEVEDYAVAITESTLDFGDAPESYSTTSGAGGPSHVLGSGLVIGSSVDSEADGQPSSGAVGDDNNGSDDEDGVSGSISLTEGGSGQVSVPVNNPTGSDAALYGWIDFNGNGSFADSGESASVPVPSGTSGSVTLDFGTVPANGVTDTYARLRLTSDSLGSGGGSGTYRDEFSNIAYDGTNGTIDWSSSPWQEMGDEGQPNAGRIQIVSGQLRFQQAYNNDGIKRRADLSGATSAQLSFDWYKEDCEEDISVYVSADGSSFDLLDTFSGTWLGGSESYDISAYASANTTVRFKNVVGNWTHENDVVLFDNVQIAFDTDGGSGFGGLASDGEVEDHTVEIAFGEPPRVEAEKWADPGQICLDEEATITLVAVGAGDATSERVPLDVVLVLDRSGSMGYDGGTPLSDLKTAAKYFVDQLDPALDRVGLVSYADTASLDQHLSADFVTVKGKIDAMSANGYTNIGQGVNTGQAELAANGRPEAEPVMIVFTDGVANRKTDGGSCETWPTTPTDCTDDAIAQAAAAKSAGTTVFTIGLMSSIQSGYPQCLDLARQVLQTMASDLSMYYEAPDSSDLDTIFGEIAYTITNIAGRDVVITEVLPPHVHYVDNSADPVPTSIALPTLTWEVGTLGIGERYTATLRVTLDDIGLQQLADVYPTSRVTYTDHEGQQVDVPFPETYIDVLAALLDFEKSGPAEVAAGETFAYLLTYENTGNDTATPVVISDVLPAAVDYVTSQPLGTEGPAGTIVWNLNPAPPGGPYTVALTVTVAPDVAPGQELVNTMRWDYGACWGRSTGQTPFTQTVRSAILGDTVWEDTNGNGDQRDETGTGIAGVTVDLHRGACDGGGEPTGAVVSSTLTSASGFYSFTVAASSGPYCIHIPDSEFESGGGLYGMGGSPQDAPGVPDDQDCDAHPTGHGITASAPANGSDLAFDFGYHCVTSIIGLIWKDMDKDGVYEPHGDDGLPGTEDDEPVLEDIEVALERNDAAANYPEVATRYTGADGFYRFEGLEPGEYIVDANEAFLGFQELLFLTTPPDRREVSLSRCGQEREDFGYGPLRGVIGDLAWYDVNANGQQDEWYDANGNGQWMDEWNDVDGDGHVDEGELDKCGVPFITLTIEKLSGPADPTFPWMTETDHFGYYFFVNLPGDDPSGVTQYGVTVHKEDEDWPSEYPGCTALPGPLPLAAAQAVAGSGAVQGWSVPATEVEMAPAAVLQDEADVLGQVRVDTDADGDPNDADSGLGGASISLYADSNGDGLLSGGDVLMDTTTTDANGYYTFPLVAPGNYVVVEDDPDGYGSTYDADPPNDNAIGVALQPLTDSTGNDFLDTAVACWMTTDGQMVVDLPNGGVVLDADFAATCSRADVEISKRLNNDPGETIYRNMPVSFTIQITNVMDTWIRVLPMRDVYSTTYLTYGYTDTFGVATFADPDSDDHEDDGEITWSDLTVTEGDLAPGASITVIVTFTAKEDTALLDPDGETINVAEVYDALADPDGDGPLGSEMPVPPREDDDAVKIETPTGVVLTSLKGTAQPDGVWITWETATEVNILGFNVRRRIGEVGECVQVNEEFIFATGAGLGATYAFHDDEVESGVTYCYLLEVVQLDGNQVLHRVGTVGVSWWRWLPAIVR